MTDYVELHCHSSYSMRDGASSPEALVAQAAALGMDALTLTDHDGIYGIVPFIKAAKAQGIKPTLGAELTFDDGHHLTLLAENNMGWANLCQLITAGQHNADKDHARVPLALLPNHTAGLIALSGCRQGAIAQALLNKKTDAAHRLADQFQAWFGSDHFFIELQQHHTPDSTRLVRSLVRLAQKTGLSIVATNNVHYATRDRHQLQDVLVCIRNRTHLDAAGDLLRPNSEFYLKSPAQMARLFADYPDAITNTRLIAERCQVELPTGVQELPEFPTPHGIPALVYLRQLCLENAAQRNLISDPLQKQLEHELTIIAQANLANYFLIVWDIVQFARDHHIRCQGRGSAANSLVAFLLNISPVNPLEHDLLFERFLSVERQAVPDIDIDFQADRREEVIQYVYDRYGHNHAAMACTFVTFQARSSLRDVGKALGLSREMLTVLTSSLDMRRADELDASRHIKEVLGTTLSNHTWQEIVTLCRELAGFPRHLGIHNGGMVIARQPLAERVPTEPATMLDRFVVQWDKEQLAQQGLVKIDLLGLRILSVLTEAVNTITQRTGIHLDLDDLTFDDPAIYAMITSSDTVGVFQVESRAQTQVLPRLKPRVFNDLIVSISLIRPGPIQGDMVHPYLRRRLGEEPITYPHHLLEDALLETLGVILFQETALKVARDLAGFTAGQGELLRRALSAKDARGAIRSFRDQFIEGAQQNGVDGETAEDVFQKLTAFGGYSFPKSHASSFAVIVYQSAWLKLYYPEAFYSAILNHQPMGFWSPAVVLNDAKRHSIQALPVDINLSAATCTYQEKAIRLGFNYVHGIGETIAQHIVEARGEQAFTGLRDFYHRTQLPQRLVEHLIQAGAMDAWGERRKLLWQAGTIRARPDQLDLIFAENDVPLPELSAHEHVDMAYCMTGVYTGSHLMARFRYLLRKKGFSDSRALERFPSGRHVTASGLQVVHQAPPTAKGFHFITLEDEYGFINVIVNPSVYTRYRSLIRGASLLVVIGRVQHADGVTDVIAQRFQRFEDG